MRKYNVAIVGATGLVGQKLIQVVQERKFPCNNLKLLASRRSVNKEINIGGESYTVEEACPGAFEGVDYAFFSAGGDVSEQLVPEAIRRGTVVIDNSSAFRMRPDVPLVVPEVNPEAAKEHRGLIANPNCSTIQMVVALAPLHRLAGLKRVVVATYQAVSGAGSEAIDELYNQCRAFLEGHRCCDVAREMIPYKKAARHHQIAFNLVPQLDVFVEDGYCKEEAKMINETRKIMGINDLKITATTVRVPVANSHSEAVNVEFHAAISAAEAKKVLSRAPGVVVVDDPSCFDYPMPLDCDGRDEVFVGRIRPDCSVEHGLNLWVVADNIRKGAATNSVQIAELLL